MPFANPLLVTCGGQWTSFASSIALSSLFYYFASCSIANIYCSFLATCSTTSNYVNKCAFGTIVVDFLYAFNLAFYKAPCRQNQKILEQKKWLDYSNHIDRPTIRTIEYKKMKISLGMKMIIPPYTSFESKCELLRLWI
jgi:hypothetical protein